MYTCIHRNHCDDCLLFDMYGERVKFTSRHRIREILFAFYNLLKNVSCKTVRGRKIKDFQSSSIELYFVIVQTFKTSIF